MRYKRRILPTAYFLTYSHKVLLHYLAFIIWHHNINTELDTQFNKKDTRMFKLNQHVITD